MLEEKLLVDETLINSDYKLPESQHYKNFKFCARIMNVIFLPFLGLDRIFLRYHYIISGKIKWNQIPGVFDSFKIKVCRYKNKSVDNFPWNKVTKQENTTLK